MNSESSEQPISRIRWQGQIESVQCRAWVWRYIMHNRTHHHLGFNLFVKGKTDGREGRFIVAVSDTQHTKLEFRIGDVFKGTAWPCIKAKHDIADYYRAGGFKALSRAEKPIESTDPPFTGLPPSIDVFERRGARMLNAKLWRKQCFTCMWANKFGSGDRVQVRESEALPQRDLLLRAAVMPAIRHWPTTASTLFRFIPVT